MTWAAISAEKILMIVRVHGKIDGPTYVEMIQTCFFYHVELELPQNFIF